jgi:predicted nucleotidyltransferase
MDGPRIEEIARRHGLLLLQFGSTVTGSIHPQSDLDLAVLLEQPPDTLAEQADLIADLQTLAPGHEVDVPILNLSDPLFLRKINDDISRTAR